VEAGEQHPALLHVRSAGVRMQPPPSYRTQGPQAVSSASCCVEVVVSAEVWVQVEVEVQGRVGAGFADTLDP
jgi:hypothetical protein